MKKMNMSEFQTKHSPVAFTVGFLDVGHERVSELFASWNREHFDSVKVASVTGDLAALIAKMEPLTAPSSRSLLVSTQSRWTAYFDNFINGTDAFGPISYLADLLQCQGVILSWVPHSLSGDYHQGKGTYGAVQFELYGPGADNPLGCIRSVSATYDSGNWRFDANGTVQSFEDVGCYERRKTADRFTHDMLIKYASALGIDAFNEDFYDKEAQMVSYGNAETEATRQCSLVEAQHAMGIR